jgi:hypothetical protein
MNTNFFDMQRFILLIKNKLTLNATGIILFTGTIFAVVLLYSLLLPYNHINFQFHNDAYKLLLFCGGIWITSNAFADLHDSKKAISFLTLPASQFEKFLLILCFTTIGYILAITIIFSLTSLIVATFNLSFYKIRTAIFNPFDHEIINSIKTYFSVQAVFALGAIYFKKYSISKTILTVCILFIVISMFTFMTLIAFSLQPPLHQLNFQIAYQNLITQIVSTLIMFSCWYITYLRLTEYEV